MIARHHMAGLLLGIAGLAAMAVTPSPARGCYAVVVGRNASADGSVLVGHNEQNGGQRLMNLRVIPRLHYLPGSSVGMERGGTLPQPAETYSFLWSENLGLPFSDAYINEWGVAIVSDGCPSREDRPEIAAGGIGYLLRRAVAQRATTAKEGVEIAGELVARYGYYASGRSYVIADPHEAWVMAVVNGKHWVAERVPDDQVVLLANEYNIGAVDLGDTSRYLGSSDLVDYAVARGWFDPASGRPFSFRAAYSGNYRDGRQERGQFLVTGQQPAAIAGELPFAVRPAGPMTVADVTAVLRDWHLSSWFPTEEGAVFQLRGWLPAGIGCIYWRTSSDPAVGILVPWYAGIDQTPSCYYMPVSVEEQLSVSHHFSPPASMFQVDPTMAWWTFAGFQTQAQEYASFFETRIQPLWTLFEADVFRRQPDVAAEALRLHAVDPAAARAYLTEYSASRALEAVTLTRQATRALDFGAPLPAVRLREFLVRSIPDSTTILAGTPTPLKVGIELTPSPAVSESLVAVHLDLTALGAAPLPLVRLGEGRFEGNAIVTPSRNGRYELPILADVLGGEREWLSSVILKATPGGDLALFTDGTAPGWELRGSSVDRLDDAETRVVHSGSSACHAQVSSRGAGWSLAFEYSGAADTRGYDRLTFSVRFAGTTPPGSTRFTLEVAPGKAVDLRQGYVDLASREWQSVELPLWVFGLGTDEAVTGVTFVGGFGGDLYLDDLRLVAEESPTTAVSAAPAGSLPPAAILLQNYPNPFNGSTLIRFSLPTRAAVHLAVHDLLGQQVIALVEGTLEVGPIP